MISAFNRAPERGAALFGLFLIVISLGILSVGLLAFIRLTHTNPFSAEFLEDSPPLLSWHEQPRGLGAEAVSISLGANDTGSGLDEIIVRVAQNNQPRELLRKSFGPAIIRDDTVEFTVNPKELGLREGNAELQVLAFDKSIWNNGTKLSSIVEINYLKPQITPLTPQQNGVLGGTELVFYKITGKIPDANGVVAQGTLYDGFPATGWSDNFKNRSSTFLAFYPIPQSFNEASDSMKLLARDNLGNSAMSSFNYRIKSRRWSGFRIPLSQSAATKLRDTLANYAKREKIAFKESGDIATDLKSLLKSLAISDDGFIGAAVSETAPRRLWRDAFVPPVPSSPNNSAGDQRAVYVDDKEIIRGPAAGVRFPVNRRTPIVAANTGTVAFIGELGLLGNTIVIDHGFGLSSVYGHLSEVSVQRGTNVEKGKQIGQTGSSGFAQSEEVYFEIRVQGVAVSPNEWWDQSWVTDHIENKVAFVLRDAQ